MCKDNLPCSLIGADASTWPKDSLLKVPVWLTESILQFKNSLDLYLAKDFTEMSQSIDSLRSEEIREFYSKHAIWAFKTRASDKPIESKTLQKLRMPSLRVRNEVFMRDGYVCQYCTLPVVNTRVFHEFSKSVGTEKFSSEKSDTKANGIVLGFSATIDHVDPFSSGGDSDLNNLVTTCWGCNFGKLNYSIDNLGINDPRNFPKKVNFTWNGLVDYIPRLKSSRLSI
jgi:5-methylcytosine-specific restriction endonuclease McrA